MAEFTAADVRYWADANEDMPLTVRDMLEAFATRLEQDAKKSGYLVTIENKWACEQAALTEGREEGRREILAEIAKTDPAFDCDCGRFCFFCGRFESESIHKPDCLWVRAQDASSPDTRPR